MMKRFLYLSFAILMFCSCGKQKGVYSTHNAPQKVSEYLYELTYTDYQPIAAERYVKTMNSVSRGAACTVIRHGNLVGRNYDYLYSDMAEFVIHVPAAEGRYASIGVASSIFEITPEVTEKDLYGQYFDILPYVTVDGMNEKGVYCSVNMVHGAHRYLTTGTNPTASESLYASMAVRYVLDHCASAAEACEALQNANIVFLEALGEFHFFVADRSESWVVEVFDNKLKCMRVNDEILTNFYVLTDDYIQNRITDAQPEGIERFEYAKNHLSEITSVDAAGSVMSNLRYSKIYDLTNSPFWYSDYYGDICDAGVIDKNMPKELYADYLKEECEHFKSARRDYASEFWVTTHTSVYDLDNLTLRVYSQENYGEHFDFTLR